MSKNLQQVGQSSSCNGKLLDISGSIWSLFYVDQLHVVIKAVLLIFNFWWIFKQVHPLSHFSIGKYGQIYSNQRVKTTSGIYTCTYICAYFCLKGCHWLWYLYINLWTRHLATNMSTWYGTISQNLSIIFPRFKKLLSPSKENLKFL